MHMGNRTWPFWSLTNPIATYLCTELILDPSDHHPPSAPTFLPNVKERLGHRVSMRDAIRERQRERTAKEWTSSLLQTQLFFKQRLRFFYLISLLFFFPFLTTMSSSYKLYLAQRHWKYLTVLLFFFFHGFRPWKPTYRFQPWPLWLRDSPVSYWIRPHAVWELFVDS